MQTLTGNVLFVVGAEREGVSQEVLDACDEVVRLPMDGFVPSYNLQVAISAAKHVIGKNSKYWYNFALPAKLLLDLHPEDSYEANFEV